MKRSALTYALAGGLCLWSLSPVAAKTVRVPAGAGTPLQDAIDAAAPGDVIKLEEAEYPEAVVITKRLRLVGVRPTPPLQLGSRINAQCAAGTALDIAADDVTVKGVSVRGGTFYTIDIESRTRVTLRDVTVSEPAFFGCGAVEYGINVFNSRDVRIVRCDVLGDNNGYTGSFGYRDAGIYIGGIPADGDVRVTGPAGAAINVVVGNAQGIIVEDSGVGPGGRPGARIEHMVLTSNATGILLRNADRVLLRDNVVNDARGSQTTVGIEIDVDSSDNLIRLNQFVDAATDVIDNGASNCWIDNTVGSGAVPTGGCGD